MLDHQTTMELVKLAKAGDESAKETLITENSPLIKSVIRRFRGNTIEYDDLYSLACVGFMKAVNNFDEGFGVRFSTYVVPMVLGEVKRFLRDDGYIKVSRAIKMLSFKISRYIDDFKKVNERDPTISEIAKEFCCSEEDVIYAMDSSRMPVSIFDKVEEDNDRSSMLIEKLENGESLSSIDDSLILKGAIEKLNERERKIIILRYYRDKTQGEIAEYFGLSQVQISRLESKIIEKLKNSF